ncbi:hypothetical protein QYE76_008492, partial [Lolium multiflorum]
MLKAAEIEIKKEHQVLMVNKTTSFKKQGKSKGKFKKGGKKAATPPMKPKNGPKPDAECYYCKEKGHWKRNCSKYLADLKSGLVKKKKEDNNDEDPAYEEAMMSQDSNKWQEAMKSEMGSMYDNKVWTLVDLPDSRKAVENKWIFKRKTDADAKLKSVRILLAIAAFFDYEIWQMDVKTAFLNGDIEEELYMVQPKGFVDPKNADKVCKLQRSIYGLKQASRSWNRRFDKVIKDFGFIQCHGEACIYKKVSGSSVAFLILYVDDILLIGNDIELLSSVKGYLNNSFSMKDLGEASYILGIKIYRDRSRRLIGLSQSTYLDKILKKFRMDESKKGFLPMLPGKVLSKTQGPATAEERERMCNIPYASAVGSIMYAMLCTRPDIAHAVSLTSRYQSDPGMEHWTAVKNILKYLKRTKDMFLCYGGDQELVVNTDANTDPDDSLTTRLVILNGVSWASSKQCTVAKSSTESEYIAASEASSEAVWMKRFIVELGVVPSALDPLIIYCDNMGAIANAQEPRSHKRLKHIKLRYHSIREYIEDGEVKICKVHTDLNVADPLTKALPRAKHDQHQNAMGVSMNIISGSCLMQDGYSFKSENNGCSIFMNNIFYGRAPQKNGLFLDLDSSDTHIHNIDAKRIKLNDNSTYMWHCRLGHIGVKRMKKLHTDGLLESLDFESLDRCEACLMGKMTKTPFSGMMERATDLLEIIHTDVCGPMSVASRGGYRYVLTFTDDLSRYGYIYFMKHKSETFEKFKEFQSEVENQRNKKIKFLRSDRGGEYLSYEFGMHLKKCGILSQLTPPGTPQRNGVSERRNRTLLDM